MTKYVIFRDINSEQYCMPIDYIKYLKNGYDTGYGKYRYFVFTNIGEKETNEDNYKYLVRKLLGSDDNEYRT